MKYRNPKDRADRPGRGVPAVDTRNTGGALVPAKKTGALPARAERQSILLRARAVVGKHSSTRTAAAATPTVQRSAKAALPVPVKPTRVAPAVPARAQAASPPAVPVGKNETPVPPSPGTQTVEVPAQNGAGPSSQTIVVQVSAPVAPWPYYYGPYWWGYPLGAPCSSRSCPLRYGRACNRWLCG
jgi:hypothetical protein